jgi:hypothetical protein
MKWISKIKHSISEAKRFSQAMALLANPRIGCFLFIVIGAGFLGFSPLGSYLEKSFFFVPMQKLRSVAGTQPELSKDLKLIIFDDSALLRIKRIPDFSDWYKVAIHLANAGYEKIFLHQFHDLDQQRFKFAPLPNGAQLITGTSRSTYEQNPRAMKSSAIEPRHILKHAEYRLDFPTTKVDFILGTAPRFNPYINHTGHLNMNLDNSVPLAYDLGNHTYLPHLSLWAVNQLGISENGSLVNELGAIPTSADGNVTVDFVDPVIANKASFPAKMFFSKKTGKVRRKFPERYQSHINGGKVALIVPDAVTGRTQFVDSPIGKVPSYLVASSLINGVLNHRYIVKPFDHKILVILWGGLLFSLCFFHSSRLVTNLIVGVSITEFVISMALLDRFGLYLPGAQCLVLGLFTSLTRTIYSSIAALEERVSTTKDLELGRVVQELILPEKLGGKCGQWDYQVVYEPFGPMAGDWVQVFEINSPSPKCPLAIIAIGDVVGKGPSAAMGTAAIASTFSRYSDEWRQGTFDLEGFMEDLNKVLHSTFSGNQTTTLSMVMLWTNQVTILNCGAPNWMRIGANQKVKTERSKPQNLVGMLPELEPLKLLELDVEPGEILVAYTDGAMDGSRAPRRFRKGIEAAGIPDEPKDVFPYLSREARRAGEGEVHDDDFTMLMIRRSHLSTQSPKIPKVS